MNKGVLKSGIAGAFFAVASVLTVPAIADSEPARVVTISEDANEKGFWASNYKFVGEQTMNQYLINGFSLHAVSGLEIYDPTGLFADTRDTSSLIARGQVVADSLDQTKDWFGGYSSNVFFYGEAGYTSGTDDFSVSNIGGGAGITIPAAYYLPDGINLNYNISLGLHRFADTYYGRDTGSGWGYSETTDSDIEIRFQHSVVLLLDSMPEARFEWGYVTVPSTYRAEAQLRFDYDLKKQLDLPIAVSVMYNQSSQGWGFGGRYIF